MRFGTRGIAALGAAAILCTAGAARASAGDVVANPGDYNASFSGLLQMAGAMYSFDGGSPLALAGHEAPDGTLTVNAFSLPTAHLPDGSGTASPVSFQLKQQQLSMQADAASGSLNPASGATSLQLPLHGTLTVHVDYSDSITHSSGSTVLSCTVGSADSPMIIPLSSAGSVSVPSSVAGVPYDQATGAVTLVSGTFKTPDPSCSGGSVMGSALSSVFDLIKAEVGAVTSAADAMWLQGSFTPVFTAPLPASPGGNTDPPAGGGSAPPPPPPPPSTPTAVVHCVVPKLWHSSLKTVRKKLAAAHCKLGKVTHAHSQKVRKGHVIKQRTKAGTTLAAGSRVGITVSSGRPSKRRH